MSAPAIRIAMWSGPRNISTAMMRSFDASDIADMREPDGAITVTCEFCNTKYRLEPGEQV